MKKRLLTLALALVMLVSLTVPAAAAQTADDRLAAVTASVKKTLALDTEMYTSFYGDLAEDLLAPSWYLEWSGDAGSLSVSATEEGKILSCYLYESTGERSSDTFAPSFPAGDLTAAKAAAQKFLNKVLGKGETFTIEERQVRLGATAYRFRGEILLNGLPAGMSYSISVRCEDNVITSFNRDDINGVVMGGIPSAKAAVTAENAKNTLRSTLDLRLEYVLREDGSRQAVLRYLPESGDEYYVDGVTGTLVNLTELAQNVDKGMSGMGGAANDSVEEESAAADSVTGSLSQAEQAGADKLKGVLDKETLDRKARAISALGLDAYTLSTVNYAAARENAEEIEHEVTATLRYGRQVEGNSWRRTVTVDAKTGELIRVYSSAWMPETGVERGVSAETARKTADTFLKQLCSKQYDKTELYNSSDALENENRVSHSFTFAQKENGYFYPGNSIYVSVDATDGSISAYEKYFDDSVTFEDPSGIITKDLALDAWLNTYTVQLGYVRVPAAVDYSKPEYEALRDYGIAYLYKLVLGYSLEREDYLQGIDAKTGRAVKPFWSSEDSGITYDDVSGHWAQAEIETLAKYGVGYTGGRFAPNQALKQIDLMALLASTEGYLYDADNETAADELYEYAYNLGLLRKADRNDSKVLTRTETVRIILDAAGYGSVAQLEGIFRTKFADDADIPKADYGYAALAQGLGMVSGDASNRFLPNAAATRAQAAVMLYNLMSR